MLCMSTGMYMYLMDAQCNCSITQDIYGISVQIQAVAIRYFLVLFILFLLNQIRDITQNAMQQVRDRLGWGLGGIGLIVIVILIKRIIIAIVN